MPLEMPAADLRNAFTIPATLSASDRLQLDSRKRLAGQEREHEDGDLYAHGDYVLSSATASTMEANSLVFDRGRHAKDALRLKLVAVVKLRRQDMEY